MLFNSYAFIFGYVPVTLAGFFLLARSSHRWQRCGWRQHPCFSTVADTPLYRDSVHLNDLGSRLIGQLMVGKGFKL